MTYDCPTPVASAYDREEHFGGWIDEGGDGEDTRFKVLREENIGDPSLEFEDNKKQFKDPLWRDPYSGKDFTDPSQLDIDHLVPLKEAWISGACFWDKEERVRYNNYLADPHHLIAVQSSLNREKSDRDPVDWLPPNDSFRDDYILYWAQIKANWGLTADSEEYFFLLEELGSRMPATLKRTVCACN